MRDIAPFTAYSQLIWARTDIFRLFSINVGLYMSAVLDQLRTEGHNVDEVDVAPISRRRHAQIDPYEKYRFQISLFRR
jgi:hypothetical protein